MEIRRPASVGDLLQRVELQRRERAQRVARWKARVAWIRALLRPGRAEGQ